jgi:site-specific recombinase XerC
LPDWIASQQQGLNRVRLFGHLSTRRRRPEAGDAQTAGEGVTGDPSSSVKALSDKTIYRIVGEALERAEQLMRTKGMNKDAETFARASTHWLRHTFGRHAMAGGVQANIVQAVLGHASLATTTRYTSADGDEAWNAVQKFPKKRV